MELIDNKSKLLGDDLKKEIRSGANIKIVASYFSIYAFEALKEELSSVEELQFIFPSPTFVQQGIKEHIAKEAREYYIPNHMRENSLYGTEFEIRLRNQLTQKAIAKECADWIRQKAKFKSNITQSELQNFIYVGNKDCAAMYTPIQGFTSVDLGYEKNNMLYQGIIKNDDYEYSKFFFNQFRNVWDDNSKVEDVTESVVDYISSAYVDNSPEFIYFVTLYNIFSEFLEDIMSDDFLPNEGTGFRNSLVWNKLYNFQKDGAIGVIQKLEKYNGCILADSVGLGKTFTALAVMKYYASRNKNILVLTPKKLANNWNRYRDNVKTNLFYKDRIHFDVLYHTDLGRKRGYSNGHDLSNFNWDNYDLIVIDESHNFRNAHSNGTRDKETRYDFLMDKVLKSGVKTKVLMLSATPVNNRFADLKNQLALAYGDDYSLFNERLETSKPMETVLINAQKAFNEWTKLPKEQRKAKELMSKLDIDFSILLDNVTIARSRKHITKYYDVSEIGKFPTRLKPVSYYCDIANKEDRISYNEIFNTLMGLTMGVYAPMDYIQPSKIAKYEDLYDTKVGKTTLKQVNREKALQRLMTINLLKRLESCVDSFRITLKKISEVNQRTYDSVLEYERNSIQNTMEFNQIEEEDFEEDDFDVTNESTLGKVKIDFADMDLRSWKRDLEKDIEMLNELHDLMLFVTPEKDLKLQKLISVMEEKIENPFNAGNRKVLVFSAFADTTNYLYEHIAERFRRKYGIRTARIQGAQSGNTANINGSKDTDRLLTLFSPISKEKAQTYSDETEEIDILIATDCVSEGQNLQDCDICINYDIHWNPVRIVQRFGRIDRIGSKNEYVQLVNFWPNVSLDEYINLNARVENRMLLVDATATGDDNIISGEQIELDYRKEQLKKLQEGDLQDLEDVDGSITITDLGLNEFRMDMISYIKAHGEPKNIANGLYAVVRHDDAKGIEKGVIFVLKNRNSGVNIERQNRLHPYYIVYLKDDGEVIYNHTEVKNILDIMRSTCKNQDKPIEDLCREYNRETKDGYKMDKYSELLDCSIESIINIKESNDLTSLFNEGSDILFKGGIKGIDDFELITFLVIK